MQEVYAGQPGRQTKRPSAELLLGVMKTISVSVVEVNGQIHVLLSPLTKVQKRLLQLWDLPPDLYDKISTRIPHTAPEHERTVGSSTRRPPQAPLTAFTSLSRDLLAPSAAPLAQ